MNDVSYKKPLLFFFIALLSVKFCWGHEVNFALEKAPVQDVAWFYIALGFEHIIPEGLDHIFFIVGICLLDTRIKSILWQATAFTVAHSITLALSLKNIITLPAGIIEPFIALSILFVAIENIILNMLKPWRIILVFFFGLVHGLGFASSLNETGLPRNNFFTSVAAFNVGVELGQILIIVLVFALLIYPLGQKNWYKKRVVYPVSAIIAIMALFWTVQRIS
jgi:hypothetical protein